MSNKSRDVIVMEKTEGRSTTSPRTWFHYLPLTIPLFPLFAANPSADCRYLPLAIPLLAANFHKLLLFAANGVCMKLPIRVTYQ